MWLFQGGGVNKKLPRMAGYSRNRRPGSGNGGRPSGGGRPRGRGWNWVRKGRR